MKLLAVCSYRPAGWAIIKSLSLSRYHQQQDFHFASRIGPLAKRSRTINLRRDNNNRLPEGKARERKSERQIRQMQGKSGEILPPEDERLSQRRRPVKQHPGGRSHPRANLLPGQVPSAWPAEASEKSLRDNEPLTGCCYFISFPPVSSHLFAQVTQFTVQSIFSASSFVAAKRFSNVESDQLAQLI